MGSHLVVCPRFQVTRIRRPELCQLGDARPVLGLQSVDGRSGNEVCASPSLAHTRMRPTYWA